jgi:hypothetical protein
MIFSLQFFFKKEVLKLIHKKRFLGSSAQDVWKLHFNPLHSSYAYLILMCLDFYV